MQKTMLKRLLVSTLFLTSCMIGASTAYNDCEGYREELAPTACDGTCLDPTPDCLLEKTSEERCGCPPGYVRTGYDCQDIRECLHYEDLPTKCQHAALFNDEDTEIKCDENGLFAPLQRFWGRTVCYHPESGEEITPHEVDDKGVPTDCEMKLKCGEEYGSELTTRKCDGTCDDPTPVCIFEEADERCGCPIGRVLVIKSYGHYCIPVYQCPNRDDLLTQCQLESLLDHEIQCDMNGLFKKKQQMGEVTKCVHPKTGATVIGKFNSDGGSIDCENLSNCQLNFLTNEDYSFKEKDFVREGWFDCEENGDYKAKQCSDYLPCKCVVPKTGSTILIHGQDSVEPDFDCENAVLTNCQKEFVAKDLLNHRNETKVELPSCWFHGHYPYIICDEMDICQCQDPFTGLKYPGRNGHKLCQDLTGCQRQYDQELSPDQMKPCDDDGRFVSKYCTDEVCMCLDADSGRVIAEIQSVPIANSSQLKCPDPSCLSNMEYSECAGCDKTCTNLDKLDLCERKCRRKCRCPEDLFWSNTWRRCIEKDYCLAYNVDSFFDRYTDVYVKDD